MFVRFLGFDVNSHETAGVVSQIAEDNNSVQYCLFVGSNLFSDIDRLCVAMAVELFYSMTEFIEIATQ